LPSVEPDPEQKTGILQELAEVSQRLGDAPGAERALIEAVATLPSNARAFARLASLFRRPEGRDATGDTRAPWRRHRPGGGARTRRRTLVRALGTLEIQQLQRLRDGIAHLQRAIALDPTLYETRFELASAFARTGANEEATRTILAMMTPTALPLLSIADPARGSRCSSRRCRQAERRPDEAVVVSELRAIGGELDDGRKAWLRARRLAPPLEPQHGVLDRQALVTHVLPPEGRHILLEVAAAIAGLEAKMMRGDLSELGLSSRDRITSRSGHPTRAVLDRVARQLGVGEVELAVAPSVTRTRVLAQDVPWVVVPPAIAEQGEMAQAASLARAVARIAYGVPWLEELSPTPHRGAPHRGRAAGRPGVRRRGRGRATILHRAATLVAGHAAGADRRQVSLAPAEEVPRRAGAAHRRAPVASGAGRRLRSTRWPGPSYAPRSC
jgi:hypothetical protein